MQIDKIVFEGYANIEKVELNLASINALVAFNNYGKSNILSGISFGLSFIRSGVNRKKKQMKYVPAIPINNQIAGKPFRFEVAGRMDRAGEELHIIYGYSFEWLKNTGEKGECIREEYLKIKDAGDLKYRTYISRKGNEGVYLSAPTGRCDKLVNVDEYTLVVNKISNFDDLFYLDVIQKINGLKMKYVETLTNPDTFFNLINPEHSGGEYSLDFPETSDVGFFIYSLKQLDPDRFEQFKDGIQNLLPSIEDFEPVEIDFKSQISLSEDSDNIPFRFPEKIYDIRVKERFNNQQTSIGMLSSGSKKIFFVLAMIIAADLNKIPLIAFEELENSVHPVLLQNLLLTLDALQGETKVLLTSHSPYLIKYLSLEKIKIGIPNNEGLAIFKEIKKGKMKRVQRMASEEEASVGDYLFGLLLNAQGDENNMLNEICE